MHCKPWGQWPCFSPLWQRLTNSNTSKHTHHATVQARETQPDRTTEQRRLLLLQNRNVKSFWDQLTERLCPIPIITYSQDVLLSVQKERRNKREKEKEEDSRNMSRMVKKRRAVKGESCLRAASRGSDCSTVRVDKIWASWEIEPEWSLQGKKWVTQYHHMGTHHTQKKWRALTWLLSWLISMYASMSLTISQKERKERKTAKRGSGHGLHEAPPPPLLFKYIWSCGPSSSPTLHYTTLHWLYMWGLVCLWAYLRSESLPSCSPSLFL